MLLLQDTDATFEYQDCSENVGLNLNNVIWTIGNDKVATATMCAYSRRKILEYPCFSTVKIKRNRFCNVSEIGQEGK